MPGEDGDEEASSNQFSLSMYVQCCTCAVGNIGCFCWLVCVQYTWLSAWVISENRLLTTSTHPAVLSLG